jgi:hypothetical protein
MGYSVVLGYYYVINCNLCPFKEIVCGLLTNFSVEMLVGGPRFKTEVEIG